jgi:anti-sigma factor RsiW
MRTMSHIDTLVDEYVLELLPADARRGVEGHVASCGRCRELLQAERRRSAELGRALGETLAAPAGRLEAMGPAVAAAAGVGPARSALRPAFGGWLRWRVAFAAFALGFLLLATLLHNYWGLQGWLTETYTPTATAQTASPTVSPTPTRLRPSFTAESVALVTGGGDGSAAPESESGALASTVTPEPLASSDLPVPRPNPSAPAADGR